MDKTGEQFIKDPYVTLDPDIRWVPARDDLLLTAYEKFLPPLVHKVRHTVKNWRDNNYEGQVKPPRIYSIFGSILNVLRKKRHNSFITLPKEKLLNQLFIFMK